VTRFGLPVVKVFACSGRQGLRTRWAQRPVPRGGSAACGWAAGGGSVRAGTEGI